MPGCCPKQLVGVESVSKGELVALCKFWKSPSIVICLTNTKSSYCPCPVLVCVRVYFDILIALNYKHILLGSLCYDAIELLIEPFNLLIFMFCSWCIELNDCDVVWSRWDWDGDEFAGDEVQLMILPTTSFHIMNVTSYWCFKSSLQYQILCPSSMVVSPNAAHLTLARPRMSHW